MSGEAAGSKQAACPVRRLAEADLKAVAVLEKEAFPDAWSLDSLKETFRLKHSGFLGAWREPDPPEGTEKEPELVGYVIFSRVPPEGEILRIAVAESARRQGVAKRLLDALRAECAQEGITRLLLEVRAGNRPAVRLYEKAGFTVDGVRKAYYQDPEEDALLMSRQL